MKEILHYRNPDDFNHLKFTIPRNSDFSGHFHLNTLHSGQKMLGVNTTN